METSAVTVREIVAQPDGSGPWQGYYVKIPFIHLFLHESGYLRLQSVNVFPERIDRPCDVRIPPLKLYFVVRSRYGHYLFCRHKLSPPIKGFFD